MIEKMKIFLNLTKENEEMKQKNMEIVRIDDPYI